jgi:NAD(P)H-hydrate repair Nnr-like enzyme with NAD(P)H-hydrate epimerase domain
LLDVCPADSYAKPLTADFSADEPKVAIIIGAYRLDMTTTLITGANGGLGFEVARQLVDAGHQVWIGARDETRGREAADAVGQIRSARRDR